MPDGVGVVEGFKGGLGVPLEAGDPLTTPFCPPRDYAAIVFFANSRFETGKRRLQFLTFGDFAACAQSMMGHWSQGALGEPRKPPTPTKSPRTLLPHLETPPSVGDMWVTSSVWEGRGGLWARRCLGDIRDTQRTPW